MLPCREYSRSLSSSALSPAYISLLCRAHSRWSPGRFVCIRIGAFRSYAARMGTDEWQQALAAALAEPAPCFMCAETPWWRCHRRLVAELLTARGRDVFHLMAPGRVERHRPWDEAEYREGRLFLCGALVA